MYKNGNPTRNDLSKPETKSDVCDVIRKTLVGD